MTPDQILEFIKQGGFLAIFVLFIFACQRKWIVFGWQYREKVEELKQTRISQAHWLNIALRSQNLVETLAETSRNQEVPPL